MCRVIKTAQHGLCKRVVVVVVIRAEGVSFTPVTHIITTLAKE